MAVPIRTAVAALCASLAAALLTTAPAQAEQHDQAWSLSAGAHAPRAQVTLDDATGTLSLAVSREGRTVIEPSPVGIVTERADLSEDLRFLHRKSRTVQERYRAKSGKRLDRLVRMNETRLSFATAAGARVDLVVRASADGIAYRYALPAGSGDVLGETSAFNLPADAKSWLGTYRVDNEGQFAQYTASTAPTGEYSDQALFATDGGYTLLAESDLTGAYSGARLAHTQGTGTYRIKLADDRVKSDGPLVTPWRAMVTGDLATVTRSTFTDDLAPASKVADPSWIRPGTVLWTWLAGGREAGQSLTAQKAFVDYAAQRNWPYEAVDAGWYFKTDEWDTTDPNWQTNSWMPELVDYARAKGVGIIVWIHQRDLDTPEERAQWLPTLEKWGVKGVKIDFMNSEAQPMLQWYDAILKETATHHLMIDFHGSTIPKGIQRTWPQVMTLEGVAGEEKRTNTAAHLTTLPFTRNVIGSMDFTPGAFQRVGLRPNSDAAEVGLSVVYESGLQMFAGTPESYEARPLARAYFDQVPAAWEDTRLLAGEPGQEAVLARRSGERWFLGGVYAGAARTAAVPLALGPGRWLMETIRDGADGLVQDRQVLRGGDTLSVDVVANGGFAALACPWRPGLTTCYR
ncbi:glycoside hydrolase family 97 protein [Streptomyces doebereineriae]|uniref:Glycoside hydrolase family 97 catalytic domain-containing protein n=1 Tax=Streptomyces doebereineriae TaxID=3075528 RepID=A0ABU2V026_9ACTN|nr:glycoside hydrolase family 97 catalytic domain-containing protein [Streptomyces sp. DSM 41640]MDT0478912.1 glycoside hydrolase family 97 catalytic domain-containing protein [Streptomyces sp. DSM 41640]